MKSVRIDKPFLFKHYLHPYKSKSIILTLSVLGASLIVLWFGRLLKALVDNGAVASAHTSLESTFLIILLSVLALALCSFGRSYYSAWLAERCCNQLRCDVYKHLLTLDVSYYDQVSTTDLVSRLTTDVITVQSIIGNLFPIVLRNFFLVLGAFVMMMWVSVKLTLLTLLIVPFILVTVFSLGKSVKVYTKKFHEQLGGLGSYIEESLFHIRTNYAFTHEDIDTKTVAKISETLFETAAKRSFKKAVLSSFVITVAIAGVCAVVYVGLHDVMHQTLSSGDLSSFIFYAALCATTCGGGAENYAEFKRASGAADRIIELIKHSSTRQIVPSTTVVRSHIPSRGTLAVHNVDFAYCTSPHQNLQLSKINFTLNPGEKIAIVGPSGSGKSTLFSLLMKFYDPQAGSIYLDGQDYKSLSLHDIRKRIALVPQEPALFSATLLDNLLYAKPDASLSELSLAIEISRLQDVIDSLPQGLHTPVGPKGIRLSGGQKQRVAIARAILRDPVLLLLDEATSALDAENEKMIQEGLAYLTQSRSSLIIAHRLSTVLHAEKIIVLNKGGIEGIGSHAELVDSCPLYRRYAMLQFTDHIPKTNPPPQRY